MEKSSFEPLKELTNSLPKELSSSDKFASLMRAFELFSLETDRLESAYNSLKEEFASIHHELDVTNQKLVRKIAELDVMTFYFESILSNIAQGILFIDLNGDVTTYNTAAEKILGKKDEKVLFTPFWQNFEDNIFGFSLREALAKHRAPARTMATITTSSDEKRELEVNATFVNEEGIQHKNEYQDVAVKKLEGIIVLIRDITDIRSLQILANRNDRMKELGEMAAMVAHEIRNPLGGIKGFASLLRRELKDFPGKAQMAENIVEGTDTLNRLVTNVLNYSRPVNPRREVSDVISLVKDLKLHFDTDVHGQEGKVKVVIDTKLKELPLFVDPQLLKSAILNLLVNARDAMPEGGDITISIKVSGKCGMIEVSDKGCGIKEENLEKIFAPFFTTKIEGNGFGLVEAHKVIQAHNGVIEVSSAEQMGTTFLIKLPLINRENEYNTNDKGEECL